MKVTTDRDRCVGAGQCVLAAPTVFDQDDDGLVALVSDRPDPTDHDDVREATELCPAQVIALDEN